jgi:ataxia telangiectasia mutated family protein
MAEKIKEYKVPPATMSIPLRASRKYDDIPRIEGFKPTMTIASGISCPKILTAIGTDGKNYKQLVSIPTLQQEHSLNAEQYKGGNDDLRQDAIMEQVFEQVSELLRNHATTRKRQLHIRTYKVLPLSSTSGIMEFVQNTIPLSDYLQPAHETYNPGDLKWNSCRDKQGLQGRNGPLPSGDALLLLRALPRS